MSENVVIVAGSGVADGVGLPNLYGGTATIVNNDQYAKILSANEYGNYLPEFWQYCSNLAEQVAAIKPSEFHHGIAAKGFTVITENIGGMHVKAGTENTIEVNGNIFSGRCLRCQKTMPFTIEDYRNLEKGQVPNCTSCGKNRVRPDIVLPQEKKRHKRQVEKILEKATAIVYVGLVPETELDPAAQWYQKVPYSMLVAKEQWGNFDNFIEGSASQWAAMGFPVHPTF